MLRRFTVLLLILVAGFMVFSPTALALEPLGETVWTEYTKASDGEEDDTNEVYHALYERGSKDDEYHLVKEWNEYEWEAEGRDLEATAVEISNLPEKNELEEWFGKPATEDGEKMKAQLDSEGTDLHAPESKVLDDLGSDDGGGGGILGAVDNAGEAGAVLDVGLGTQLLAGAIFGPLAFQAGVDIGHGLAQRLGFTKWEEEEEKVSQEEALQREKEAGSFHMTYVEASKNFPYIGGFYLTGASCDGLFYCSETELEEADSALNEQLAIDFPGEELSLSYRPILKPYETKKAEEEKSTQIRVGLICESSTGNIEDCLVKEEKVNEPEILGVPQTGLMTPAQEAENVKEHLPAHPASPEILPPLPSKGPIITKTIVRDKVIEKALETPPYRKLHEEVGTKSPEEIEELETQKLLEIPPIGHDELYTQYKTRVETAGFTDIQEHVLPESGIDTKVGPEEVTTVSPAPGSEQSPSTKVDVDVNPEDAPVPEDTHAAIPGPTQPGIKFPRFAVLCKGFPFGVPCWIAETISGWSASATAPEWGVNEIEVYHHKIPPIKFNLAELEPIMEYVRPAILIFATIGLVLLFFSFAKGGGPPSGGNSDTAGSGMGGSESQGIYEPE